MNGYHVTLEYQEHTRRWVIIPWKGIQLLAPPEHSTSLSAARARQRKLQEELAKQWEKEVLESLQKEY
jgi:hypothetical protein